MREGNGMTSTSKITQENILKRKFFNDDKSFALWKLFGELEERNESLNDIYDQIDENKDGILTREEIKNGLLQLFVFIYLERRLTKWWIKCSKY